MGFIGFDHPYCIWSSHITQRIIPYINLSQRVYVFSSASLLFSLREEDSQYDKNRSLMINITRTFELQVLNQEHWESDFYQIEWTGIDFIYLSKPSYFVSGKCFNMLELYMQILIIPSLLQLMILVKNLRCRHDTCITMILRRLWTLSTQSSLMRTPTLVWVASHQNH